MGKLVLDGLSRQFRGGGFGLRDLSLVVEDGEFLTLVGPSGCGKSTTLNVISGLEAPTSGRVLLDGVDVTRLPPGARDVAMVFQSYALYPHFDVRGNLAFPLKVAKLGRAAIDARVAEVADLLGLGELLSRKPRDLSGGQRQRVALGRALVRRPKLFLLDEPLSNLDAGLRAQMRGELKKLHERLSTTFVYVTHDQAEAMTLSSRVVVMRAGRVEQVGTPREIYDQPVNTFVAGFFGSPPINLLPAKVFGQEGETLGIRPEHVEVGAGTPGPAGAKTGRVFLVESFGADTFVTVEVDRVKVTARARGAFEAAPGSSAWISLSADRALAFDQDGRRAR